MPTSLRHLTERLLKSIPRLYPSGSRLLIATSGGPDSQMLLDFLGRYRQELHLAALCACGIDHGLRPAAPRELALAATQAAHYQIPFITRQLSLGSDTDEKNLLARARKARYQALYAVLHECGADYLAVAHTINDQVETLLFHLSRGSGLRGASGMRPKRGLLLRPLLEHVERQQILTYLDYYHIPYAEDPTNTDLHYTRAKLRAHVLPGLVSINKQALAHFVHFAQLNRQDEAYLQRKAQNLLQQHLGVLNCLTLQRLTKCKSAKQTPLVTRELWQIPQALLSRVLRAWLQLHHLRPGYLQQLLIRIKQGLKGGQLQLSLGKQHLLHLQQGRLWLRPSPPRQQPLVYGQLSPPTKVTLLPASFKLQLACKQLPQVTPADTLQLLAQLQQACARRAANLDPWLGLYLPEAYIALDSTKLRLPLQIRTRKPGDVFSPYGISGQLKIGDLFTNYKIPLALREVWPLLLSGDEILWVVGLKRSRHALITPETAQITLLKVPNFSAYRRRPGPK